MYVYDQQTLQSTLDPLLISVACSGAASPFFELLLISCLLGPLATDVSCIGHVHWVHARNRKRVCVYGSAFSKLGGYLLLLALVINKLVAMQMGFMLPVLEGLEKINIRN